MAYALEATFLKLFILLSVTCWCTANDDGRVPIETSRNKNWHFLKNEHLRKVQPAPQRFPTTTATSDYSPWVSVLDFGAKGDNSTDNTKPFQDALDHAANADDSTTPRSPIVYAPPGLYLFQSSIRIPPGVTLRGSYSYVPSHDRRGKQPLYDGTILLPLEGRGTKNSSSSFVELTDNAALMGVVIYHPQQESIHTPVSYPWSVMMTGNNAAVSDVELLNSWNGINATGSARHYIARIQGQPINIGVYIDATYDIGRVEDVHFNPWFSVSHPFIEYQLFHGRAFVIGRSDWEYVFNTFAFGYAVGYHFIETSTGNMNGNFLGIGADLMTNASVLVDAAQPAGILITNGEFTAFANKDWEPNRTVSTSSQVVVSSSNQGPVKFVNTAFWGPSSSIARISGTGVVTFDDCQFVEWGEEPNTSKLPAVDVSSGRVILTSNVFHQKKLSIDIGKNVSQAIVSNNMFSGSEDTVLKIPSSTNANSKQIVVNSNSFPPS